MRTLWRILKLSGLLLNPWNYLRDLPDDSPWWVLTMTGKPRKAKSFREVRSCLQNNPIVRDVIGRVTVSTTFLSHDHSSDGGPPVLWETIVFGNLCDVVGELDSERRYSSEEAAIHGHNELVSQVERNYWGVA